MTEVKVSINQGRERVKLVACRGGAERFAAS